MKNAVQATSSILVGVASLVYLAEHLPPFYYRARSYYYEPQMKNFQQQLRSLSEMSSVRLDLEWTEFGKQIAERAATERSSTYEMEQEEMVEQLRHAFCVYGLSLISEHLEEQYCRVMKRALHPKEWEQFHDFHAREQEHVQSHRADLQDAGFDMEHLAQVFQPA